MSLDSDCLRATVGLFPKAIAERDHVKARELTGRWERRLKAWLGGEQQPFEYREPPGDMEKLFTRLAMPLDQLEVAGWLTAIGIDDVEMTAGFVEGLVAAREHLKAIWPALTIDTAAGPEVLPLAHDEAGDMAAVFAVLDDPDRLLDEMETYTLEPAQATAFRSCFADLYDWAGITIQRLTAEKRARDKAWVPSWQLEAVLRVLKGMPPEEAFTPAAMPAPPTDKLDLHSEAKETQAQLTDQPVGRDNPSGQ